MMEWGRIPEVDSSYRIRAYFSCWLSSPFAADILLFVAALFQALTPFFLELWLMLSLRHDMMGDGGFAVASKIKLDLEVSEVLAHNARRLHNARITTTAPSSGE